MKDKRNALTNEDACMEWNVVESAKLLSDEQEKLKFNQMMIAGLRRKLKKEQNKLFKAENANKFMAEIV